MKEWYSYPSIYNLGHKAVQNIFDNEVIVQEKVDGSQISFGRINGEIVIYSKRCKLYKENPDKMFSKAIDYIYSIEHLLEDGVLFRGEYLQKPRHNCLAYSNVPTNNIVLFDACRGYENYVSREELVLRALQFGFDSIPFFEGKINNVEQIKELLERESYLGGTKVEGIVIKAYNRFGPDKKTLMAKYVSEAFKEKQKSSWKVANPTKGDILQNIIETYRTEARWNKSIQHLRDDGVLTDSPKDIGPLIKEIQTDIEKEYKEEIMEALYKWALPHIKRGVIGGFPEHYKKFLLEKQFT